MARVIRWTGPGWYAPWELKGQVQTDEVWYMMDVDHDSDPSGRPENSVWWTSQDAFYKAETPGSVQTVGGPITQALYGVATAAVQACQDLKEAMPLTFRSPADGRTMICLAEDRLRAALEVLEEAGSRTIRRGEVAAGTWVTFETELPPENDGAESVL